MSVNAITATRAGLLRSYVAVREASIDMCRPLKAEDYRIQSMPSVSPPWWNLGHTSWFFARNVLGPLGGEYGDEDARLDFLLNSYYVSLGPRVARPRRGLVTRPTTEEVYRYRQSVDRRVERLVETIGDDRIEELAEVVTIGIQHEQQHQELFYTEIKHILFQNPPAVRTAYHDEPPTATVPAGGAEPARREEGGEFVPIEGGLYEFGCRDATWCWDNELPVHKFHLSDFAIARRPVTCGEFLEFIEDGGYRQPLLWLDNGWTAAEAERWQAPLYWDRADGQWRLWTLGGMRGLRPDEPVCHVSFYEAEAFARWASQNFQSRRGARLPTEREWEQAARLVGPDPRRANLLDAGRLHPAPAEGGGQIEQMLGDVWEWTLSAYEPYPGYRPFRGALAEYNSKFMDNQRVLRGGSCATPANHIRISYRNYWAAPTRFQFTGFRLARDAQ